MTEEPDKVPKVSDWPENSKQIRIQNRKVKHYSSINNQAKILRANENLKMIKGVRVSINPFENEPEE